MSVVIRPPNREQNVSFLNKMDDAECSVNPGDVITADTDFMRGHGTYQEYGLFLMNNVNLNNYLKN